MAWTTPRTWVAGEIVTAAIMNTHVRDNLNEIRNYYPRVLFSANGSLGNATTVETTWYSRTIPANTMFQNGYMVVVDTGGTWAANGNTKTVRFYFGDHGLYYTLGNQAINGNNWRIQIRIQRTGSSTARATIWVTTNTASSGIITAVVHSSLSGLDFTTNQTIYQTGQGGATSDIIINDYKVVLVPGDPAVS